MEQARQYLKSLGLKQAVEVLDNTLDTAASKQLTYPEMLEQFDFSFEPSIDERQVKELGAALAFVAEATNVLMLGPPGGGKTHLAVALAKKAIEQGYGAYFVRAYEFDGGPAQGQGGAQPGPASAGLLCSQGAGDG